ncbi:hypothetical protein F5879DRAFT_926844 [Lentinula edodes]|nr:hypothetical protein F5879DRAFT_926844 [Lentinula edodes]
MISYMSLNRTSKKTKLMEGRDIERLGPRSEHRTVRGVSWRGTSSSSQGLEGQDFHELATGSGAVAVDLRPTPDASLSLLNCYRPRYEKGLVGGLLFPNKTCLPALIPSVIRMQTTAIVHRPLSLSRDTPIPQSHRERRDVDVVNEVSVGVLNPGVREQELSALESEGPMTEEGVIGNAGAVDAAVITGTPSLSARVFPRISADIVYFHCPGNSSSVSRYKTLICSKEFGDVGYQTSQRVQMVAASAGVGGTYVVDFWAQSRLRSYCAYARVVLETRRSRDEFE